MVLITARARVRVKLRARVRVRVTVRARARARLWRSACSLMAAMCSSAPVMTVLKVASPVSALVPGLGLGVGVG